MSCPERRERTAHRNCDVRGRGEGAAGEGVCRQTKVRYQLLKAARANSVGTLIVGEREAGGRGGGWRLLVVGGDGGPDGRDSPQLSRASSDAARIELSAAAHPASDTGLSVSSTAASFIYLPLFAPFDPPALNFHGLRVTE